MDQPNGTPPPSASRPPFPRRVEVKLVRGNIERVSAPVYVFGIFDPINPTGAAQAVDVLLGGALSALVQDRMIGSRLGEISLLPTPRRALQADMICFAGLGPLYSFEPKILESVLENLVRVFITSQLHSFATVAIGSNTGMGMQESLTALMNGILRGLHRRDPDHDFRTVYLCERDNRRYEALLAAAQTYCPPPDLAGIEVAFRELSIPGAQSPMPLPGVASPEGLELTYLTVDRPQRNVNRYQMALLTAGQGAAIHKCEQEIDVIGVSRANQAWRKAKRYNPKLGRGLADVYLPTDTRSQVMSSLKAVTRGYLVVVHDRNSADIPWEALVLDDGFCPAVTTGISRRLVSTQQRVTTLSNLSSSTKLRMLLVRNPTRDRRLEGAEQECDFIIDYFKKRGEHPPTVLAHEEATVANIVSALKREHFDVFHYAGHAIFDKYDKSKSGLICHGDERLTAAELGKIDPLPQLFVLNGCESAKMRGEPERGPGDDEPIESTDDDERGFWEQVEDNLDEQATLAEALMLRGAANLIGTYWPVGDPAALEFAQSFYPSLLSGDRLGIAMRTARRAVQQIHSRDWANYLHYGDPEYVLRRK